MAKYIGKSPDYARNNLLEFGFLGFGILISKDQDIDFVKICEPLRIFPGKISIFLYIGMNEKLF